MTDIEQEEWRAVVGFEGAYEVSNMGRVRSLDRLVPSGKGDGMRKRKGQILRPGRCTAGHLSVSFGKGAGSQSVHVLVCIAFNGPKPEGMECLHWNDIPNDNRASNLRWGTRKQNLADAARNGKQPLGEKHRGAKLKDADIPEIRKLLGTMSMMKIGRLYGVSWASIRQIRDNKCWTHVK